MAVSFEQALKIAKEKYPHRINHHEEYKITMFLKTPIALNTLVETSARL